MKKTLTSLLVFCLTCTMLLSAAIPTFAASYRVGTPTGFTYVRNPGDYNMVLLRWNKARNATSYKIYRKTGRSWSRIKTTKHTYYYLTLKKSAYYRIRAYRGKKHGSYSKTKKITYKKIKVGTPTNVRYSRSSSNKNRVTLKWDKVKNASCYRVFRQNGSKWTRVEEVYENHYTFTIKKTASYKVRAYYGDTYGYHSKYSKPVTIEYKDSTSSSEDADETKDDESTSDDSETTTDKSIPDFDLYTLKVKGGTYYNDVMYLYYIKTPEKHSYNITLGVDGSDRTPSEVLHFDDVKTLPEEENCEDQYSKVDGGYVIAFPMNSVGTHTISLYYGDNYEQLKKVKTWKINIADVDDATTEWCDELLSEYNTGNSLERLQKISNYLRNTYSYPKHAVGGGRYHLAKDAGPSFVTQTWDSIESPGYLKCLAERINETSSNDQFDKIECLADVYDYGTTDYQKYHAYIRVTYKGEQHLITACPNYETGNYNFTDSDYIDFSDLSQFNKLDTVN
jgi:hypothetical protein